VHHDGRILEDRRERVAHEVAAFLRDEDEAAVALEVALDGKVVLPRELLKVLVEEERSTTENLSGLSPRKQEILALVAEGLSNAQIARRSFLSESTIKQHLRAAYKVLGVKNRTEAATVFRRSSEQLGGVASAAPYEGRRQPAGAGSGLWLVQRGVPEPGRPLLRRRDDERHAQ
jgi:DNA-binding CsgD family transcriptional regulator